MVIATKMRWTNLLQINLKINDDIINVKSRDFGKTLQLPFSKDYSYQIWTLGNAKDTNQSYINLTATDDVILTKSLYTPCLREQRSQNLASRKIYRH